MRNIDDISAARATVLLQIRLNKTLREKGHIPCDMYLKANDVLQERLCSLGNSKNGLNDIAICDIIT